MFLDREKKFPEYYNEQNNLKETQDKLKVEEEELRRNYEAVN